MAGLFFWRKALSTWTEIVRKALWEVSPLGHPVYKEEVDNMARALKRQIMMRFKNDEPIYFIGIKEIILKLCRRNKNKHEKV